MRRAAQIRTRLYAKTRIAPRPRPASRMPFWTSAFVTAAATLVGLLAADGRRVPALPGVPSGDSAFVDPRVDVPHPGNPVARSIVSALDWLERHQYGDGMWSSRSYAQMCEGKVCSGRGGDEYDVGVTALAALAALESGLPKGKGAGMARRALRWLGEQQDPSGCIGPRTAKYMYGHAIATLAFARGYVVLGETAYKHHVLRGTRFLELARNPGRAWRYGVRDGENDTSVTAWATAALLAAGSPDLGLRVDPRAFEGVRHWLDEMTGDRQYEVSYRTRGAGSASIRGLNEQYDRNEGLTAMALWMRLELGENRSAPEIQGAARRLSGDLPVWTPAGTSADFAAWFAGTRALARYGEAELWGEWSGRVARLLVARQRKFNDGCAAGSWDPADKWGGEGGRIYATAMNLLTLSWVEKGTTSGSEKRLNK